MLIAIREEDNEQVIGEYISKDKNAKYLCPCCKQEVIHNRPVTRKRIGHFSHKVVENSECPNRISESQEHLKTKLKLYDYLVKVNRDGITRLEAWIAKKRRPDILLKTKDGIYIAFEIQCSSIGLDELKMRNKFYTDRNIHVNWLIPFDFSRFLSTSETASQYPIWESEKTGKNYWGKELTFKSHERFFYYLYEKKIYSFTFNEDISYSGICYLELEHSFTPDSYHDQFGDETFVKSKRKKTKLIVSNIIATHWRALITKKSKLKYVPEEKYEIPETTILVDKE